MLQLGVEPDEFCVAKGIATYANSGALRHGMWIHEYIRNKGLFGEDLFVGTALVDIYAKCGCIKRSVEVSEGLFKRNEYSWAAMIGGFALHGLANQAICSLERMVKEDGVCPNGVMLLGVLTTCTHVGLEEEGTDLLEHMEGRYGVVPKHEHYSCTVNLLCRARQLDKVLELMRIMIMKPLASVWGALLSACSIKGNVELAELVAKELLDLEPSSRVSVGKDVTYVQQSNIYVGARRCSDTRRVRKMMAERGIKKTPSCSVVKVNGVVNEFVTGDAVFGKDKNGYIRCFGDMFSAKLESTLPFRMKLANEKATNTNLQSQLKSLGEQLSGCSPFANVYRPSIPVLPRSCELLDWYGATVAYGTLLQGGRASRDFYNILIDEIVHVTGNGPLEDVVAGEIIVWEKSCTVFI
ncbi:hypothetical protein GIB67_022532 [Kingdonia uniflora]|uniref:Pentatricopeptide repeat-containing protein n=1 Tax=Kingdonia uniflora TaxID=39325 RepID=A0A7J7L7I2_9MAGN|nr:hypothetical protein GIB67_022532 [Kingdonia uniflora]